MVLNSLIFIQIFVIHLTFLTATSAGIKCPGYCTKAMVAVTRSCSSNSQKVLAQKITFFKSPDFPDLSHGDLNCEFHVKLLEDTVGLRIEFIIAEMDGMSYLRSEADGGNCESDMIFFRGFGSWSPPPLCGNLTGYISILDKFSEVTKNLKTFTIVALMSSLSYRWHIKIHQISKQQYNKNETVNANEKAISDYEDISIMEEGKPSYRYRRSENSYPSVTEDSLESISTTFTSTSREIFSDLNHMDSTNENLEFSTTIATTPMSATATTTAKLLSPITKIPEQGFRKNITLNQYKEKTDFEKPEHRFDIPLIVNGQDTEVIQVPWQASIRVRANNTKAKLKSIAENEMEPSETQPDVQFNEIDSNKTQLDSDESILINGTEFNFLLNQSTVVQEKDNCSESEGFHFCGGILIANNLILSAAHCFFGNTKNEGMTDVSTIEVVLGDTNLCTDESKQEILPSYSYDVENILIHYAYDPHLLINDIAILKLKQNVTIADNVHLVNLAETGANFNDHKALVSGWGDTNLTNTDEDTAPSILQSSMDFRIQNKSFCNERDLEQYSDTKEAILKHPKYQYVFESTLCTKGTKDNQTFEISSGKGDSGGGLIIFDDFEEPILAGIVSYGVMSSARDKRMQNSVDDDSEESQGVTLDYFTSVSFYRKWIELAMI